jgi:hypothetical protein
MFCLRLLIDDTDYVSMKYNLGYTVPLFAETICYFQSLVIIGQSSDQSYISFIISR